MEVYVIANIRNSKNVIKGYRLVDITPGNITIKDVTKDQLLYVLKRKKLKLENAKHNGNKIMGIYSPLDNFNNIICDDNSISNIQYINKNSKSLVLKYFMNKGKITGAVIANSFGNIFDINAREFQTLINERKLINVDISNGVLSIKAKQDVKKEIEITEISSDYITDEEARDPNVEWEIDRFIKYMEQRGYTYRIYTMDCGTINITSSNYDKSKLKGANIGLSGIDTRCKILHIPNGITEISYLFDQYKLDTCIELDTLIISRTVKYMEYFKSIKEQILKNRLEKHEIQSTNFESWLILNNLYFQKLESSDVTCGETIKYNYLNNITILEDYNIPTLKYINEPSDYSYSDALEIQELFNECKLPFLIGFKDTNTKFGLNNCFNSVVIKTNGHILLDLSNVEFVRSSFKGININSIIIGDTIETIHGSFGCSTSRFIVDKYEDMPNIDWSSSSLRLIHSSFNYSYKTNVIKKIDLSPLKNRITISRSFISPYEIEEIILPENLESLEAYSFKDCQKLKKVKVPKNVVKFQFCCFHQDTDIDWSDTDKTIATKNLLGSIYCDKVLKLDKQFVAIDKDAFKDSSIVGIDTLENITQLGENSFKLNIMRKLDTMCIPKVTVIPKGCFSNQLYLQSLAIQNNIKEIEEEGFADCNELEKIFIGDSIELIGKNAFRIPNTTDNKISIGRRVYVIKNSYAHNYFKNKKAFTLMVFDNYEKAYNAFLGLGNTTELQQKKFKMVMSNSEKYQELLEESYLENCIDLYNIAEKSHKKVDYYDHNFDESMIDLNGALLSEVSPEIYRYIKNIQKNIVVNTQYTGKYTKIFTGYIHLFNKITSNKKDLFKNKDMTNTWIFDEASLIYFDDKCAIVNAKVKNLGNWRDRAIMFIADDRIVWSTLYEYNSNSLILSKYNSMLTLNEIILKYSNNDISILENIPYSLEYLIKQGDYYNAFDNVMINGFKFPPGETYNKLWNDMINYNWILLWTNSDKSFYAHRFNYYSVIKLVYFDLITHKIIKANTRISVDGESINGFGSTKIVQSINSIAITEIIDLDKYLTSKKEIKHIDKLNSIFNNKELNNKIKLLSLTNDESDRLYKADNAYDTEGNTKLISLAKKINSTQNYLTYDILNSVIKSNLCMKTNANISKIIEKLGQPQMISIPNTNKVLLLVDASKDKTKTKSAIGDNMYMYGLASLTDKPNDITFYASTMPIDKLINHIKLLDRKLEDRELHEIVDTPININDFTCMSSAKYYYYYNTYITYDVAIQNSTGEVFILANTDDISYYTIFRFKNYIDALVFLHSFESDKMRSELKIRSLENIYELLKYNKNRAYDDYLCYIRQLIIRGVPNNYPIHANCADVFEMLAKQPKL